MLIGRVVDRQYLFRFDFPEDVMDGGKDKASAWGKDRDHPLGFFLDIFKGTVGQNLLSITAAAPEGQMFAKLRFSRTGSCQLPCTAPD